MNKPMNTLTKLSLAPRSLPLALGALFVAACSTAAADPSGVEAPARPGTPVQVAEATEGPVAGSYAVTGTLRGVNTATLTSRTMGYVRTLEVAPGEHVTAGQLLATLDDADPRAGLLQAQAGTLEAQAALAQYEQQSQAAEAALRIARTTHERMQAMRADRAVSQQQADEAEAAFRAAEAQFEASRSGIRRADSRISQSRAFAQSARAALEYTRVRAPFDGVVLSRPAQVGDLAAPGAPLFVLEQVGGLRVEVAVPESLAAGVALGQEVDVQVDAASRTLRGTIGEVSPQVDAAARSFSVKVDLPADALEGLRAGMFARVFLARAPVDALTVPASAITARGSVDRVFVVQEGVAQLRLVTRGAAHGERVAVLSGLSPGEAVIVDPPTSLRDRDSVEVTR